MKILWLINIPLPDASILFGIKSIYLGGWLVQTSKLLSMMKHDLYIMFPYKKQSLQKIISGSICKYIVFKPVKDNDHKKLNFNKEFATIIKLVNPDIVHIHGTEMAHSLSMINTCNAMNIKTVLSIQGLVSIISQHVYSHLPFNVVYGVSFRNLIMRDSVHNLKKLYDKRGHNEIKAIQNINNIIGRTTFDQGYIELINRRTRYYVCNEILREEFYNKSWSVSNCQKYSIFLSQGLHPIKGLHVLLNALSYVVKEYPKTKLFISGSKPATKGVRKYLYNTRYINYIISLINKYKLSNNVFFIGSLGPDLMVQQFLKSNVFICPSVIENSPNSLGEAMLLGVPSIASYVGGIPDMLKHNVEGFLYPSDAHQMLAHYICILFQNNSLATFFSNNARKKAEMTHSPEINSNTIIRIYNEIIETQ